MNLLVRTMSNAALHQLGVSKSLAICAAIIPVKGPKIIVRPVYKPDDGAGVKWQPVVNVINDDAPRSSNGWEYNGRDLLVPVNDLFVRKGVSGVFPTHHPYNILGWLAFPVSGPLLKTNTTAAFIVIESVASGDSGSLVFYMDDFSGCLPQLKYIVRHRAGILLESNEHKEKES